MSVDFEDIINYLEDRLKVELTTHEQLPNVRSYGAGIDSIGSLKIYINPNEHTPPHFHVNCQGINAAFTIKDCKMLKGMIDRSYIDKLRKWHLKNKELLIEVWDRTRPTNCPVGMYIE